VRTRWIVAGVLAMTGLVWIGQGLGIVRGSSFMVDDPRWATIGAVCLVAGALVGLSALRNRRRT